jgi:4a-hydroxytetrahydrobiopterin dehydratase
MWQETNNALYRKFEFKDFSEAFAFMTRVAFIAEKMDHHPKLAARIDAMMTAAV